MDLFIEDVYEINIDILKSTEMFVSARPLKIYQPNDIHNYNHNHKHNYNHNNNSSFIKDILFFPQIIEYEIFYIILIMMDGIDGIE